MATVIPSTAHNGISKTGKLDSYQQSKCKGERRVEHVAHKRIMRMPRTRGMRRLYKMRTLDMIALDGIEL